MKKLILILATIFMMVVPMAVMAQAGDGTPWYLDKGFWLMVGAVVLLILNYVIKLIPTTKPIYFIFQLIIRALKELTDVVPDRKTGGGRHKKRE